MADPSCPKSEPAAATAPTRRPRARDLGSRRGILKPGPFNTITDVAGVAVGHVTLFKVDADRIGVTAIRPHAGNVFQDKTPAGFAAGNGFGKFAGSTQITELGEIETPVILTNTLSVAEGIAGAVYNAMLQAVSTTGYQGHRLDGSRHQPSIRF
jgi:D-aminopeptidase